MSDGLTLNPEISRSALAALHDELFGWAMSRVGFDRDEAEDLVQQAYVELLSGRAVFNGDSSLKTFAFRVVQNLASTGFRKLAVRRRYANIDAVDDVAPPVDDRPDADAVWSAVMRLPARQRDVIELVFCRELTVDEAARVMGIGAGSARTHYARAKDRLAEWLGEFDDE
jgi:RNA polymerase sigma-70 factor (ECF subfamily)